MSEAAGVQIVAWHFDEDEPPGDTNAGHLP